tara:strand:- start:344 stop:553 length:210 start_codon:yes stop_codon:yes gene_type:complete
MKKQYYFYKATISFTGCTSAVSEEEAIDKVVKESEKYPEQVIFKPEEVRVKLLKRKPEKGLYHDPKYEL